MISTRDTTGLPGIHELRRLTRSLAMLDAILSPDWELRYHSFDAHWGPGELMASMRNGQGDDWFALFSAAGVVIIGLDHEAAMYRPDDPWPGLFDGIPPELSAAVREPAFDPRNSTFCLWRTSGGDAWHHGPVRFPPGDDPDGSAYLLSHLDGRPESCRALLVERSDVEVPLDAIASLYRHVPLTDDLVARLNPRTTLGDIVADAAEIGYPEH